MSPLFKHRFTFSLRIAFVILAFLLLPSLNYASNPDWQQEVNYLMKVTLVDSLQSVTGEAGITYINNSPDTLATLWFRLPPEALHPGSPSDEVEYRGRKNRLANVPEQHWGSLKVHGVVAEGRGVIFVQDGSIGRLDLIPGILPGDSAQFTMSFTTRFPSGGAMMRIGYMSGQYKGAYWYPSICPYTPDYGWTVNRYFGTAEAFGEFGTFEVHYTVPNRFIVAASGELVNEEEVLPPERLEGLSINNPDPIPIPGGEEGDRLVTWIYVAENVPDVAFAADPNFVIDRVEYDGYEAWSFVRRGRQKQWDDAAEICGWTIGQLEEIYGEYPWTRVTATDSWSAMEYPTLTMMSSETPGYRYVMMHEVIHNYTPMILHSSSVDAPVLDEGFTTFVEQQLIERFEGTPWNREQEITRGLFSKTFKIRDDVERGARPYLESVLDGEDLPMVRGADVAEDYHQLRVSTYYKTPVMLNALCGVVGEERFRNGMRTYYADNKLTHITEEDMIASFSKGTGQPLGWFFKQFLYDDGDIDYKIAGTDVERVEDGWKVSISVKRIGEVRLPLRLAIVTTVGDTAFGEIAFLPTDPSLPGFDRWGTWDQLHQPESDYEVETLILSKAKPEVVFLDPEHRYTDRRPQDNHRSFTSGKRTSVSSEYLWDWGLAPLPPIPVDKDRVTISPAFGYHPYYEFGAGFSLRSSYMEKRNKAHAIVMVSSTKPIFDLNSKYHPVYSNNWEDFAEPISGLVETTVPLGTGYHPGEIVIQGGMVYDLQWALAGWQRSWKSRENRYRNYLLATHAGAVEKLSFMRMMYQATGRVGEGPWYNRIRITFQNSIEIEGMAQSAYSMLQLEAVYNRNIGRGWRTIVEGRQLFSGGGLPVMFRPTLNYNAPYMLIDHPAVGPSAMNYQQATAIPRPTVAGALVSYQGVYAANTFTVGRISLDRKLPSKWRRTGNKPYNRLLDHMRYGIFGAVAYVPDPDLPFDADGTLLQEAGFELRLEQLYGFSIFWRVAPFASTKGLGDEKDQIGISSPNSSNSSVSSDRFDWKSDDWLTRSSILIQFNTNLLAK